MIEIVGVIIAALLSFVGGWALWQLQRQRFSLEYTCNEFGPFPLSGQNIKTFVYELTNTGNAPISDIDWTLNYQGGVVDSIIPSNHKILKIGAKSDVSVSGTIPLINPSESLKITVTLLTAVDNASTAFEARALGVNARLHSEINNDDIYNIITNSPHLIAGQVLGFSVISIIFLLAILIIYSIFSSSSNSDEVNLSDLSKEQIEILVKTINQSSSRKIDSYQVVGPDTGQIVFVTFNEFGLSNLFPKLLLQSGDQISFWKTGFYVMHSYLLDKNNAEKYVGILSKLSQVDYIATSSRGLLLYLAGKIERLEGREEVANRFFEECKKAAPYIYKYLMENDHNYDIESIRLELSK